MGKKQLGGPIIVDYLIKNQKREKINREELLVCETIGFFFLQSKGPEGLLG